MAIDSILYKKYNSQVKEQLKKEFNYSSTMEIPKLEKIVINMGLGKAVNDKSIVTNGVEELSLIVGQKANPTYAKKSNASYKIREGMPIGAKVTLRGQNMWNFLDKLIAVALPRIRDFRGIKTKSFDGNGNFSLGIKEIIIFPEIDLDKIKSMKGMDISLITSAKTDKEAFALIDKLGMPFNKTGGNK